MIATAREVNRRARAALLERFVRRSGRRVGVVLVYHRLAASSGSKTHELNPALGLQTFARELAYLQKAYEVVPPSAIVAATAERVAGEPIPVALTFDDDTRSHVDEALVALDDAGVRAGFYLGGWSLTAQPRPWWETLQLATDHDRLVGVPLPLAAADVDAAARREPRAIHRLGAAIEQLGPAERRQLERMLAEVTADLERDPGLDPAAIRTLAVRQEIGFHTRGHDPLATLSDDALSNALVDGRDELEAVLGRPIDTIAYPHGSADAHVTAAARAAGYRLGLAGLSRAVTNEDEALLLPRLSPWHTSVGTFAVTVALATLHAGRRPARF